MPDTYADFHREPSKPHQCMHHSEKDGTRCRAIAMHNELMCFHHRPDSILPVLENDPFLLESLDTRADIQRALGQLGARLACNHMDFERARLLMQVLTAAMRNLPPHPRPTRQSASEPAAQAAEPEAELPVPIERDYTAEEMEYLGHVTVVGFEPYRNPRPASVTDDDIINRTNECRRRYRLSLLKPKRDASGALIAVHEQPNRPAARITRPAACAVPTPLGRDAEPLTLQAIAGQPATGNLQPATLPTLQAAAGPPSLSKQDEPGGPAWRCRQRGRGAWCRRGLRRGRARC